MFSKEITNSSDFQMMSPSAQALYFHIGMNADDDGFCEVFTIMRMTESKPDDLRALAERSLIYLVDSKVCIVKDWHVNNYIQGDRYTKSKYLDDPRYGDVYKIIMEDKVAHLGRYSPQATLRIHDVSKMDTQVRSVKESIGKNTETVSSAAFDSFWEKYPKKVGKGAAMQAWKKLRPSNEFSERIISSVVQHLSDSQWRKEDGRFIPNPATFLNQGRYDDEISVSRGAVLRL